MPSVGRRIKLLTNSENDGKNYESKEVEWIPEKFFINKTERNEAQARIFGGNPAKPGMVN